VHEARHERESQRDADVFECPIANGEYSGSIMSVDVRTVNTQGASERVRGKQCRTKGRLVS
jgi:hypothetical protein